MAELTLAEAQALMRAAFRMLSAIHWRDPEACEGKPSVCPPSAHYEPYLRQWGLTPRNEYDKSFVMGEALQHCRDDDERRDVCRRWTPVANKHDGRWPTMTADLLDDAELDALLERFGASGLEAGYVPSKKSAGAVGVRVIQTEPAYQRVEVLEVPDAVWFRWLDSAWLVLADRAEERTWINGVTGQPAGNVMRSRDVLAILDEPLDESIVRFALLRGSGERKERMNLAMSRDRQKEPVVVGARAKQLDLFG